MELDKKSSLFWNRFFLEFEIERKSSDTWYFKNQVEIDRGRVLVWLTFYQFTLLSNYRLKWYKIQPDQHYYKHLKLKTASIFFLKLESDFFDLLIHCTIVCFASFLSGGFTTMAVINPPESKLAKRTSVHCLGITHYVH